MIADVIIAAAGKGERLGLGYNKLLMRIEEQSILYRTVSAFVGLSFVHNIIVSISPVDEEAIRRELDGLDVTYAYGGDTRTDSVKNALALVTTPYVLIHDGARPFVTTDLITKVMETTVSKGACIPALPITDTVKRVVDGTVVDTPPRSELVAVQTPQGFDTEKLRLAYSTDGIYTDDASAYERIARVYTVMGEETNTKITTPSDISHMHVGVGVDVHRLVEGRPLMLGGVEVPYDRGLLGHSDADVIIHAICDAMLSAAGERDIGVHFPDTDPEYEGIAGLKLLALTRDIVLRAGYTVNNISAVIEAERPKLKGYIPTMKQLIASTLSIPTSSVSIMATTTEGLGFVGEGLGMRARAYCSLRKI